MKSVYGVLRHPALNEPIFACESREDALILAEQVNYLDEGESPEDYVTELPLIEGGGDE